MERIEVLMVEDNRGDVVLLAEAVARTGLPYNLNVVTDGVEAIEYLRRQGSHANAPIPDLIVLDLKLPKKNGREVLDEIQPDPALCGIPLVVLSSSRSELELATAHKLPAQSHMVKPSTFDGYVKLAQTFEKFLRGAKKE